jgi:hypothetical protein
MADVFGAAGSKLYISTAAVDSTVDTFAEFAASTITYVLVSLVENMGEFGDQSNPINFAALEDSRVRKTKGARDAGIMNVVVGHDPQDTGQLQMETAEGTNQNFAFKVDLPDAANASFTDTLIYFRGLVMGKRFNVGTVDQVIRKTYQVAVNSRLYTAADPGP